MWDLKVGLEISRLSIPSVAVMIHPKVQSLRYKVLGRVGVEIIEKHEYIFLFNEIKKDIRIFHSTAAKPTFYKNSNCRHFVRSMKKC